MNSICQKFTMTALYDNIKQNFDNRDELVKILTSAFNDTYSYLGDNDQQPLAFLLSVVHGLKECI